MAYILRRVPEADWLDLKWGEPRTFADADHDGVPDRDGWLEHAGLATDPDPSKADTDGDGLSDYQEFMAMNGNANGHGERLHPALHPVDPTVADSDVDGLPDGLDPLPYLPMPPYIPQSGASTPRCTLELPAAETAQPLRFDLAYEPDQALDITLAWGDTAADAPDSSLRLSFDLDNDGWFDGDDNYRLELDGGGITRCVQNKAASDTVWPAETPGDSALAGYAPATPPAGYRHACTLRLACGKVTGLQAKPGERIGVNIGVKTQGEQWYYTFAEPNSLLRLTLR
jgi:hypothetical protein